MKGMEHQLAVLVMIGLTDRQREVFMIRHQAKGPRVVSLSLASRKAGLPKTRDVRPV